MNDKEFIERASIAALQSEIVYNGESSYEHIAIRAVSRAETLLKIIKRKDYSKEEEKITQDRRIEELEYVVGNIIRVLEQGKTGWINSVSINNEDDKSH